MEFLSAAQKECYEKIKPWILDRFESALVPNDDLPLLIIPMGSAAAMVEVYPWGEEESMIKVWSYVVTGAELRPDLLKFLLEKNVEMNFGAFGIDLEGDIRFEHAIVGSTCDHKELYTSLTQVLMAADRYDDEIMQQWGGKRAVDRYLANPPIA